MQCLRKHSIVCDHHGNQFIVDDVDRLQGENQQVFVLALQDFSDLGHWAFAKDLKYQRPALPDEIAREDPAMQIEDLTDEDIDWLFENMPNDGRHRRFSL